MPSHNSQFKVDFNKMKCVEISHRLKSISGKWFFTYFSLKIHSKVSDSFNFSVFSHRGHRHFTLCRHKRARERFIEPKNKKMLLFIIFFWPFFYVAKFLLRECGKLSERSMAEAERQSGVRTCLFKKKYLLI